MAVTDRVNMSPSTFFSNNVSFKSLTYATQEDGQKLLAELKKSLVSVEKLVAINGSVEAKKARDDLMDCIKKIDTMLNHHQKTAAKTNDNAVVTENTPSSIGPRQ